MNDPHASAGAMPPHPHAPNPHQPHPQHPHQPPMGAYAAPPQKKSNTLLIVLIIVGGVMFLGFTCVAIIAVPIYQELVEQAKWVEADSVAVTIEAAVRVHRQKHAGPGELPMGVDIPFSTFGPAIGVTEANFYSDYFTGSDITLRFEGDGPQAAYVITINGAGHGNTNPRAPSGRLLLRDGNRTIED